jgi:hypothetical protein
MELLVYITVVGDIGLVEVVAVDTAVEKAVDTAVEKAVDTAVEEVAAVETLEEAVEIMDFVLMVLHAIP